MNAVEPSTLVLPATVDDATVESIKSDIENLKGVLGTVPAAQPSFKLGDTVAWTTEQRIKGKVAEQTLTGNVVGLNKEYVFVEYSPGKVRQVKIGTLKLRKM